VNKKLSGNSGKTSGKFLRSSKLCPHRLVVFSEFRTPETCCRFRKKLRNHASFKCTHKIICRTWVRRLSEEKSSLE
jgi:hypothetical protein